MTEQQKRDFQRKLTLGLYPMIVKPFVADIAIEWIRQNLSPDEVFPPKELAIWCDDHKDQLENKLPIHY